MLHTDCNCIQIPLTSPHFNLMFLSMESSIETQYAVDSATQKSSHHNEKGDTLCKVLKESTVRATKLDDCRAEHFFNNLNHCNLSEVETEFCQRARTVFSVSAVRRGSSFFAPFWACHAVVQDIAETVDSIVVDLHQGNAFNATSDITDNEAFGIPLTGKFLTVKAYPKENSNRYFLCTEGMSRFGLPELNLPEVPSNLAADGAYLLRAIGQFLWSKLENIHPEQPYLSLGAEIELNAIFCEYGNPAFHAAEELTVPFALEVFESKNDTVLVVRQPKGYDDYYDWFLSINESIVEHRLNIQRSLVPVKDTQCVPAAMAA